MDQHINLSMTWEQTSRILIALMENGTAEGKAYARSEIQRMGKILDRPLCGSDIVFLHGRDTVEEEMDDWGYEGPTIEGVAWIHGTYGGINVAFISPEAAQAAQALTGWEMWDEHVLGMKITEDLIEVAGKFYGDWEMQSPGWRLSRGER